MKKLIVTVLVGFVFLSCFSQEYIPSREDINAFFKSKTLIVLEDNPLLEYNIKIKEVVQRDWKITDYEFIFYKEFDKKRLDPQFSFLLINKVYFEKDRLGVTYKFLSLLLGGNPGRISRMPDICSVPLGYFNVDEESYVYKLGSIIRFIQNHVKLINDNPNLISSNIFKFYNKNISDIKNKVFMVIEEELGKEVNTLTKIKKVYPYEVRFVSRSDIEKAIDNKEENIVYLHKVGPEGTRKKARCYKMIIGVDDSKFYYFDYHMINDKKPDGFLLSDFKKMPKR